MSDDLIAALSIARQFVPNGTEAAERVDTAMRTALEAQIAAVAPAVDAQPVGEIAHNEIDGFHFAPSVHWLMIGIGTKLYASAQSEGVRTRYPHAAIGAALISTGLYDRMNDITGGDREARYLIEELISKVDPILDTWHNAAMSQHTGEKDD